MGQPACISIPYPRVVVVMLVSIYLSPLPFKIEASIQYRATGHLFHRLIAEEEKDHFRPSGARASNGKHVRARVS
jgi:hypothetical protein